MTIFENPWFVTTIGVVPATILLGTLKKCWEYIKISKKATIQKGLSLQVSRCKVNIKVGQIQDIATVDKSASVVLPANTSFIDDCITDSNSALGAYFMKHFPSKISNLGEVIKGCLNDSGKLLDDEGDYPPGTSIILPSPYDSPVNIILTASTIRKKGVGIVAEPSNISKCIEEVFELTSDKKIRKLYLPILGSGHGGLDLYDALVFLILAIKHSSNKFHHIKEIDIAVREDYAEKFKNIYKLQYLILVKKEYDGGI